MTYFENEENETEEPVHWTFENKHNYVWLIPFVPPWHTDQAVALPYMQTLVAIL